jgi:hypothetical protein
LTYNSSPGGGAGTKSLGAAVGDLDVAVMLCGRLSTLGAALNGTDWVFGR